jgi:phage terminase Nu1 subunit (DNA packaging protein)
MKKPNQTALAKELGLSRARITQLKRQGMPTYSAEAAKEWHRQNITPKASSKPMDDEETLGTTDAPPKSFAGARTYDQSRARREAAEAEMAEMKQAEMQGALIRTEAVRSAWAAKITVARDALLQIPARVGPLVAAEPDLVACTLILENAIHAALTQLSSGSDLSVAS